MSAITLLVFFSCHRSLANYFSRRYPNHLSSEGDFEFSVFLANVYAKNRQHEMVIHLIEKENPDIVVLIEINEDWETSLKKALKNYGTRHVVPREGFYGISIFSKIPLKLLEEEDLGSAKIPSLHCAFERADREIVLWATHPPSPRRFRNWRARNEQLMNLSRRVSEETRPTLIVGDLNTSPWSASFKISKAGRLRDSAEGFGIRGTWSARMPFFMRIPLDSVLVSPEIRVLEHRVLEDVESDHLPIFVRFGIIDK